MISLSNTPRNPTNYHFAAAATATRKQRMSLITPVQAGGLVKLEKLKKLWTRRVKPIIATASINSRSKVHRRRTVAADMIGFPQDFTHSKHVGMHEFLQVEPHLRNSNDVPYISLFNPEEWTSLGRLHELEAEAALDITHEDHTMPFISAKYTTRHSLCASLTPARPTPTPKKVKRKSVPIDFLQDMIDSPPREVKPASIHESNRHRYSRVSIEESILQLVNYEQPQKSQDNQVEPPTSEVGGATCHF